MLNGGKKHTTIVVMLMGLLPAIIGVALLGALKAQSGSTIVNYLTFHLNNARTGWNMFETQLTPANIRNGGMTQSWLQPNINGQVYAAPLYYNIDGQGYLFVVSQTNQLTVLNADTGAIFFQQFIGQMDGRTERALSQEEFDMKSRGGCGDINPWHGATSTPVIDPDRNVLYMVNLTMENNEQVYKLHAIDLSYERFGREVNDPPGFPIVIRGSYEGEGFQAFMQTQRSALTLQDGVVYITFSSRCDNYQWHGWVFGYDIDNPTQPPFVFCTSPDGDGAGIWGQGGLSIATEPDGTRGYVVTGNVWREPYPFFPATGLTFPQSILRLDLSNPARPFSYNPRDYFYLPDYIHTTIVDTDVGGSSGLIIPDQAGTSTPRLLLTAGKDGRAYLINRDNLGGRGGELQHLQISQGMRTAPSYFEDEVSGGHFTYVTGTGQQGNYMDWQNDPLPIASEGDENVNLSSGPALAEFQTKLFVAWVNYDVSNPTDRSVMIKASPDARTWPDDAVAVGGQAAIRTSPSLAVFETGGMKRLYVAWVDGATRRIMIKSSLDGQIWSDAQMLDRVAETEVFVTWATLAVYNNRLYIAYIPNTPPYNIMLRSTGDGTTWSDATTIHAFTVARIPVGAPFIIGFNGKLYAFWLRTRDDRNIDYKISPNGTTWPANPTPFGESAYQNSSMGGMVLNNVLTGTNPGPPRLYILFIANNQGRAVLAKSLGTGTLDNPDQGGNQDTLARVGLYEWMEAGADGGQVGAVAFRGKGYYGFGTRQPNRELRIKSGTAVYRDGKGMTALRLTGDMVNGSRFYPAWTSNTNYTYLPGMPLVTSNGRRNGIVWVAEGWNGEGAAGVLRAYNAVTGEELFPVTGSLPIGGRKFQTTVVVNGTVYLASTGVVAYRLRTP